MIVSLNIIGTGGSGGWFCQLLSKAPGSLFGTQQDVSLVRLIDGDRWEQKNMDRQFCTRRDLGKPKPLVFQQMLDKTWDGPAVLTFDEFFEKGSQSYEAILTGEHEQILVVAVDNHPARKLAYELADERNKVLPTPLKTKVITLANEYSCASAWAYIPSLMEGTAADPRVRWPEILTDVEGDPLRPSCTGEVLESSPQLALSNMLSASAGAWLLRFWVAIGPELIRSHSGDKEMQTALLNTFPVSSEFTEGAGKVLRFSDLMGK